MGNVVEKGMRSLLVDMEEEWQEDLLSPLQNPLVFVSVLVRAV